MRWKWMCIVWVVCVAALAQEEVPPAFERAGESIEEAEEDDPFDPALHAPKSVRVQVEFIDMTHKTATKLLMEDKSKTSDATALRMKLQALADKDEAKVLETQIVIARSNQKASVESHHEMMYPIEFEPVTAAKAQADVKDVIASGFPVNPAMPTTFETRNVGSTLEVEPVIAEDDKIIDLRFVPQFIWHTGNQVWYEGKDSAGNLFQIKMPNFYTIRLNTSIVCIDGQYFMAGLLSPKNDKGVLDHDRKVMVFVKCDILASVP